MTTKDLGGLSVGACVPIALTAAGKVVPKLQAQLTGALAAQAKIAVTPPSAAASIEAAYKLIAALKLNPPQVAANVTAIAKLVAQLQAEVAAWAAISATLGVAGVHGWSYTGRLDQITELAAATQTFAAGQSPVYAVLFLATDSGAIEAMQASMAG